MKWKVVSLDEAQRKHQNTSGKINLGLVCRDLGVGYNFDHNLHVPLRLQWTPFGPHLWLNPHIDLKELRWLMAGAICYVLCWKGESPTEGFYDLNRDNSALYHVKVLNWLLPWDFEFQRYSKSDLIARYGLPGDVAEFALTQKGAGTNEFQSNLLALKQKILNKV